MTLDLETIKRRRNIMMAVCLVATLIAIGSMMLYLRGQDWAVAGFVVALLAGFGSQMWFMGGVRGRNGDS
jgi:hypothetical protein